jgi:hypothetical protein
LADIAVTQPTALTRGLSQILAAEDIQPGDDPSYEVCKAIWLYHPLGNKMVESPIRLAQSQEREISIATGPEEVLVKRFNEVWKELELTRYLRNLRTQARVYGLASIGCGERGKDPAKPIDLKEFWKSDIYFNVWDPLNTSGLVVDQDPNSSTFQKFGNIKVGGKVYDRSRTKTVMNEESVYLAWTVSGYGYTGRSCFQRGLFPLKSFINTMVTDDMVSTKAGLIVARVESSGSIVDRIMGVMTGVKRFLLRRGRVGEVLSIGLQESVESLNLRNVDASMREARINIIKNIATSNDEPAVLLLNETFVHGFGEGTEDSKAVAQYIDGVRIEMAPEYAWADTIVQYRAWSPEFYETVQSRFPHDYGKVPYEQAFNEWRNSYSATWPNLLKEPESELAKADDVKLKAAIAAFQVVAPVLEAAPQEMKKLVSWFQGVINNNEYLFTGDKMDIDFDALQAALEDQAAQAEEQRKMMSAGGPGAGTLAEQEHARPAPPESGRDAVAEVLPYLAGRVRERASAAR